MPRTFAVYVPNSADHNLQVGLDRSVWGWKDSVVGAGVRREVALRMRPGDTLVMATGGPNPRIAAGGWGNVALARVILHTIGRPLYGSNDQVWPDDVYPHRVDLHVMADLGRQTTKQLGLATMEALRRSAATTGCPPVEILDRTGLLEALEADVDDVDSADPDADFLDLNGGATDALSWVVTRREQKKLRRAKFGNAVHLTCDLCARTWPRRFVRAAHIKRRSNCTLEERADLRNVMAACVMGCDELFEHGYIGIQDAAVVARPGLTGDVSVAAAAVAGNQVLNWSPTAEGYAAEHRLAHQLP